MATSNSSAAVTSINRYDEYGAPASGNSGRFQYTGQACGSLITGSDTADNSGAPTNYDEYGQPSVWVGNHSYAGTLFLGISRLNYNRARIYDSTLGRFLQTDPIGYGDGMNMYAYVGGDPINMVDPSGTTACTGSRIEGACKHVTGQGHIAGGFSGTSSAGWRGDFRDDATLQNVQYRYEEGRYVGGSRDGQLAYRTLTGVSASYSNGLTLHDAFDAQLGPSFQNIPADSQGFSYVGRGNLSSGPMTRPQRFNVLQGAGEMRITTRSAFFAQPLNPRQPGAPSPIGSVKIGLGGCETCSHTYFNFPVMTGQDFTRSFTISRTTGTVSVGPTVITPRDTYFQIWVRR